MINHSHTERRRERRGGILLPGTLPKRGHNLREELPKTKFYLSLSYPILSCLILSHPTRSYLISFYPTLSFLIRTYPIPFYPPSHLILSMVKRQPARIVYLGSINTTGALSGPTFSKVNVVPTFAVILLNAKVPRVFNPPINSDPAIMVSTNLFCVPA